jgi:Flp pilus assembly protein TadD
MLALGDVRRPTDLDAAYRHLTEAVRLNPNVAESRNDLGTALQLMGRTDEAVLEYRVSIRMSPGFARPHSNLATALLSLNRPADAAAEAREALRLQPQLADAHAALGVALLMLGDPAALTHLQTAVNLRPNDATARERLALALERVGRTAEAAEQRRIARQLP